ncbi:hypothetical protein pdam_00004196, partial [Pocillopora damicornis]
MAVKLPILPHVNHGTVYLSPYNKRHQYKASSVRLIDDSSCLPFTRKPKISKSLIAFKRLRGESPFKRKLDGGKTSNVTTCQPWNSLPITLRQKTSVQSFKKALRQFFFGNQH